MLLGNFKSISFFTTLRIPRVMEVTMSGLFRTGLFCNLPIGREFTIEPHTSCLFRKIDNARAELISGKSFQLKRKGTKITVGENTDCFVKQSIDHCSNDERKLP